MRMPMVESPSSVAQEAQYSLLVTGDRVLNNIHSLVCGVVPEHGLLDRESVRRLIEVSSD